MNALKVGTSWPLGTRPATVETVAVELHYPDRTDYWVVEGDRGTAYEPV